MSILDKASLIQIPSGYKSTKLYSLRPINGDGDFTFARSSSGTRVNSEGLIETASVLGSELVTNGDFEDGSTDWSLGNGWTIANGKLTANNAVGYALQGGVFESGVSKTYRINLSVSNYVSGYFTILTSGGTSESQQFNANGNYTIDFNSNSPSGTTLHFTYFGSFTGSIDNISVKEVISATNTPRIDYSTGEEAFLLEPQSTNLFPYSEFINDTSIFKNNASVTDNYSISPEGVQNAALVDFGAIGTNSFIGRSFSTTPFQYYTFTCYVKGNGTLRVYSDGNGTAGYFFTSKNLTLTSEWQRFEFSYQVADGVNAVNIVIQRQTFDTTTQFEIYGLQFENQSYATSYIPTDGASATRNGETCVDATPTINSEEGVLYAEVAALANDGTNRAISISDGTTTNVVRFYYSTTDNRIVGNVKSGGSSVFNFNNVLSDATNFLKIAVSYKANDFKMYVNGTEVSTDTSGSAPVGLIEVAFDNGAGNDDFYGKVKGLQVFDKALSDYQLKQLTTI